MLGVLALQGAFIEHQRVFASLGVSTCQVRTEALLSGIKALVIPGGESTAMALLMEGQGLIAAIRRQVLHQGMAVWGTCAGMILLSCPALVEDNKPFDSPLDSRAHAESGSRDDASGAFSTVRQLALMNITVGRNAFGRQIHSFMADIAIRGVTGEVLFPGVFIRAPRIDSVGAQVTVLARLADGTPVAARQHRLLATAFHPELTDDNRMHRYFLEMIRSLA